MVTLIGALRSPVWQYDSEILANTLEPSQEMLLRTALTLTEWYSLEILTHILEEIHSRGLEDSLSPSFEKSLLGILGFLEEFLRSKGLKVPETVLESISEAFGFHISRSDVVGSYARIKNGYSSSSSTNRWTTLRLKIYEHYDSIREYDKDWELLESSLFIVELLESMRTWYLSPKAYAKAICELVWQKANDKSGEVIFKNDKEVQKAKVALKRRFGGEIPLLRSWREFELELIRDLWNTGASLEEIYAVFREKGLRRSLSQLRVKVKLMGLEELLNPSERHQNFVDDALLAL